MLQVQCADPLNFQLRDNLDKKFHTNNQQKCTDCLKARSNKNEHECKKCGCDYFCVPNY